MPRFVLFFLGPPGSGKGTQSDLLAKKIDLPVIATGELLRREQNKGSRAGKKIASLLDSGQLVPDKLVYKILRKRTKQADAKKGFLVDGFPRHSKQLPDLVKLLKKGDSVYALHIEVGDREVKKRIGDRRVCDCGASYHLKYNPPKKKGICDLCGQKIYVRTDDKPAVVAKRLTDHHRRIQPLLDYFDKHYKLITINGEQSITVVTKSIFKEVKKIWPN